MTEYFESGRSLEEIVKGFVANYEIYSADLRDTGIIQNPEMLFKYYEMPARQVLLNGVAAYVSLPHSVGERKRLIKEALHASPLLSESARAGLGIYNTQPNTIRLELGCDWRNWLIKPFLDLRIARNEKDALEKLKRIPEKFQGMLDTIMRYIPLPIERGAPKELFALVDQGVSHGLMSSKDAARLRTYLEDFIIRSSDKRF